MSGGNQQLRISRRRAARQLKGVMGAIKVIYTA
jgi:hypothetical protein